MKVERLLTVIDMLRPVLERYRGQSIEEMILDIDRVTALTQGHAGNRIDVGNRTTEALGAAGGASRGSSQGEAEGAAAGSERVEGKKKARSSPRGVGASSGGKKRRIEDVSAVVLELEGMNAELMSEYLKGFLLEDLVRLARGLGAALPSKPNVNEAIAAVVRSFEEKRLPEEMARRRPADDTAFMEEMRRKYGF